MAMLLASGDVGAGERCGRVHDFGGRAAGDEFAAVTAGAGAEIDDVVGAADGFFVVLDDSTVLPRSRRFSSAAEDVRCRDECRPMEGSSRT